MRVAELLEKKAFLFDLDGTLYRGRRMIEGADATIAILRQRGILVRFLSNNSNQPSTEIAAKLAQMGIDATPDEIYTPLTVSGSYLMERFGLCRVYVIGSRALAERISASGHVLDENNGNVVFVGRDLDFSFDKLQRAGKLLQSGAGFVSANCDLHHPGEDGYNVPETGALTAAIACLSNRSPIYIGKPETTLFSSLMTAEGLLPDDMVMVGDNLLTDIAGGIAAGIDTLWLSGGCTEQSQIKPTMQADSVTELYTMLVQR